MLSYVRRKFPVSNFLYNAQFVARLKELIPLVGARSLIPKFI